MALGEFELIERFFKRAAGSGAGAVALGVGDDCALLRAAPGTQLAISSDMLVEGRHFFANVDPALLGHKALAVNLSDLAACGAKPVAFTLALALPKVDEAWLAAFSRGLFALADTHGCALIGGDTTRGPLNICITIFGEVPVVDGRSQALLRLGARPGDDIYVSGTLGDARFALEALLGKLDVPAAVLESARLRLERPTPRVALGLALRGLATAAIDVSDGLLGDLAHILKASACGATIDTSIAIDLMAVGTQVAGVAGQSELKIGREQLLTFVLAGGDDYELLFTAPPSVRATVQAASMASNTPVSRIGQIELQGGLRLIDARGQPVRGRFDSFDHFGRNDDAS